MHMPEKQGLYDPRFEHDACGVGFVADMHGRRSHEIVRLGLSTLCNLDHRGATNAEVNVGDGAGILVQVPDAFLRAVCDFELPAAGSYALGLVAVVLIAAVIGASLALAQLTPVLQGLLIGLGAVGLVVVLRLPAVRPEPAPELVPERVLVE